MQKSYEVNIYEVNICSYEVKIYLYNVEIL